MLLSKIYVRTMIIQTAVMKIQAFVFVVHSTARVLVIQTSASAVHVCVVMNPSALEYLIPVTMVFANVTI